jgi:NAD(P)-dependent dehydrogenase (short-subunit alcohol dehydrogenase family)
MKDMAGRLKGKIAVVTAAGQGIGRAIAEAFVREGDAYRVLGVWRGDARVRVEPFDAADLDLARLCIA